MKTFLTACLGLSLLTALPAQESETPDTSPAPRPSTRTTIDVAPELTTTVAPKITRAQAATNGEVRLYVRMNSSGYVTEARVQQSSNPELNDACLEAVRQWRYQSVQQNGAVVGAAFLQSISLGDGFFQLAANFSARPHVTKRAMPALSETQQYLAGQLIAEVQLDNVGRITSVTIASSTEEDLNGPTVAAVAQWSFSPAYLAGKPVPSTVYIPFDFVARQRTGDLSKAIFVDNSQLQPLRQPNPRLPGGLADVNAEALVELVVDQRGFVVQASTLSTTNAEVAEIARQTVLKWRYVPVVREGNPVAVKARQPFRFGEGAVSLASVDQPVKIKYRIAPELPASLDGASGFANVVVEVDATGRVSGVEVRESSHAEFKLAVVAAVKQWTFVPALRGGVPVSSRVSVPFVFGRNK